MEVSEIFARLKAHILEGIVFHDEMVRYYGFLNLDDWKNEHEWHYTEETDGYRQLCDYYMNHYNALIPVLPMDRPDVIPESWYRHTRQDVDETTKKNAKQAGINKWVDWERETKDLYQDMWKELVAIGEIAAAQFISRYIRAVDNELKNAEKHNLDL